MLALITLQTLSFITKVKGARAKFVIKQDSFFSVLVRFSVLANQHELTSLEVRYFLTDLTFQPYESVRPESIFGYVNLKNLGC